jgi:non-ribosomal peptide synthetase component F
MCTHLRLVLERIAENPDSTLAQLTIPSEAECHYLLHTLNDTAVDYRLDRCLHQIIEDQVERSPDAPALSYEDTTLSYRELNERSNRLAHHLSELGVGPDVRVGLCVERSIELIVSILAVLKAGGDQYPDEQQLVYPGGWPGICQRRTFWRRRRGQWW